MARTAISLAILPFLAAPALAETWTVDDDGPADFIAVQDAIDAAADGDTIVVRGGVYGTMVIDGKGLTMQADGDALLYAILFANETLEIRNLAPDQEVYLRGFGWGAIGFAEQTTALVENNDGPILFEDCVIEGAGTAISIKNSVSVTFVRSELLAPPTFANYSPFTFFGFAAYSGLAATDSNLFLYDTTVRGSSGSNAANEIGVTIPPAPSLWAASLNGSTMLSSGSTFTGGSGGSGTLSLCYDGEDGSAGLILNGSGLNPESTVWLLDTTITGGSGGTGTCGGADGMDGADLVVNSGTVHNLPGTARTFYGDSPAVEDSTVNVHLEGEPGDAVILHVQIDAVSGLFLDKYAVALHLPFPVAALPLATIPASGALDIPIVVPPLFPGAESFRFVGQALFVGATGFYDGGPSTLLLVDSAL